MRIAVLTSLYPLPEAPFEGLFAARKWEGMAGRGHEVEITAPVPWAPRILAGLLSAERARVARAPGVETRGGIRVRRPRYLHLPGSEERNAARFAAAGLRLVMKDPRSRPDAVVLDYAWPAAAAAPRLADLGVPVVVNGRGSDVLQVRDVPALRAALARGLAASTALTAVSQDLLDAMGELRAEAEPAGPERRRVLTPNGVDGAAFRPGDRAVARARVGEGAEGELVVVIGHLIARKDPLLALRAFHAAGRDGARLVFVGRGPLAGDLRAEAERLGIGHRVSLAGERPPEELVDWYRAANALLLTSSREGRPNVVLEALSSGCPVLATAAGGTAEVVPDHERMLARTRRPEEVGQMLSDLLDSPPAPDRLRAAVEPLSWAASLDALEALLAGLVARSAETPER